MFKREWIEAFRQRGTPFYFYDIDLLRQTLAAAKAQAAPYGFRIHYAMKANFEERILREICAAGLGADCVSGNEVKKAVAVGFPPSEILFAGVGKTDAEIVAGLENDIGRFNCESLEELAVLNELAGRMGKTAPVALRINPDLDARTHQYITTGREENKFGLSLGQLESVLDTLPRLPHIKLEGVHCHVGSQIGDMTVFRKLAERMNEIQQMLEARHIWIPHLNMGGGLGVDYRAPDAHPIPDFATYFAIFGAHLQRRPGQTVHFELGRALVAQCGSLISRVVYVKKGLTRQFVILDAGMTELIRPALYQAYHHIENLTGAGAAETYDVVGPICESSDTFAKGIALPKTQRGDIMALRTAGAYARVMASHYNLREIAPAVYSDEL